MKLKEIITESSISPTDELVHRLKKLSLSALDYESINRLMQHISKRHGLDIYGEKLHKLFVQKYKHSPNVWAKKLKSKLGDQDVEENFIGMDPQGVAEGLEHYDGIEISMEKEADEIMVKAMRSGGRELGHVLFVIDGEYLAPQDLEVDERYRGQGIAQTMYDYVKSKGYKIRRSGQQTDAGAGFWDKHKPGKNIWEQGVAEDWNKVNHHDKTNGLSQKAVNAYRREHPGSKLQTAVTTKPSKLKAGSKAAKRRKSFCARMSGNKGPMKKPNGKPTPKALALRRWNCESIEEMRQLIETAEKVIVKEKRNRK